MNELQHKELIELIDRYSREDGIHDTAIPGVWCIKSSSPSMKMPVVYNPSFCVIVQGKKEVMLEGEIFRYEPSEYLVVSVNLPATGQVTEASPERPYLSLQIDIDPNHVSELITQMGRGPTPAGEGTARGLFVDKLDGTLTDAVLRLVRLLDAPGDVPLVAPMIMREICYRLLSGAQGKRIAQIAVNGSHAERIAKVIQTLKEDVARTIRIEYMAELAYMSPSSFHYHFKEMTAMSPLQYQKHLRLLEARRIMLSEGLNAENAAHRVGYKSPSHFSREYTRMFGAPPARDVEALRDTVSASFIQAGMPGK